MDYAPKTAPEHKDFVALMLYYQERIRAHNKTEQAGSIMAMKRCLSAGLTLAQLWQAVRTYEQDPWQQNSDQRLRKSMRGFFTPENIRAWQTPIRRADEREPPQETLQRLQSIGQKYRPAPTPIVPEIPAEPEEL